MTASAEPPQRLATWDCHAGDVAFAVTAPSWWLPAQREYLSGFVTTPPGELDLGRFSIRVRTDDAAFRQIVTTVAASPVTCPVEPVPGLVMLESVQPGSRRCYVIAVDGVEHQPGAYAVAAQERHIDLFLHSGTARPHRYPIRFMREAMLRTYEDAGGVIFHAAGVDAGGAGVMVSGRRGAGKTTITAALLRSAGAALLSNDRLIACHGEHLVAVPLPVPAARGTIEAFPELKDSARRVMAGTADLSRMPAKFGTTVKHAFTARQFARAFNAGLVPASVLRLVVVPHLTDTSEPARVRHLPEAQARQVITENCFTPRDEFWIRPWLIPRQRPDDLLHRQADAAVGHITATVPCVEVSFGVRNPVTGLVRALERVIGGVR
jgi:hypothetical protein